ncbi:putative oxidoreductase SA2266 [Paraliobacillus ryukyuensis]|uniref:Short-subunit dehydrogenase n=1 Tax=Paraliobacillus ryukyuensis TaxID=200904 RepID=A0A366EJ14_9BACI|nr:SDR family oxidoreductase [Paraliobacillus ryukyuensis]RBP01469.1 hypothetical protein DES48_101206 [Paraliobacillus ryukyuensis]
MRNFSNKRILLTGASSGIGKELAQALALRGANLILVARSTNKLLELKQTLEEAYAIDCAIYTVDLSKNEDWVKVLEEIKRKYPKIDALINNAGYGLFDQVEDVKTSDVEHMFQVNVFSLIESVKQLLPSFLNARRGHIINVASFAGKIATPKSSVYGATKHAVVGFSNALRLEVEQHGVYVTTVNLGPVRTNFFHIADPSGGYQQNVDRFMIEPSDVVRAIINSLFIRKREINLPRWMELGNRLYHLFPTLSERLLASQFNQK